MPALYLVPYGLPAARALRDAVVAAKGDGPLAPVTVAVPSNYAGLSLRRRLGRGELSLSPGREGLVNVRFLVLARVAELLGAPELAARGKRPLTSAVRGEAVRAALAAEPGILRPVAEHAATERSLESTFRDLASAPREAADAIAGRGERAGDVVRLFRDFAGRTAAYYDETALALTAAEAVRSGAAALRDVGHVILYLPRRLSPADRALVEALAERGGLSAVIGLTGDATADEPARRLASQLETALGPPEENGPTEPPHGSHVIATPDAEEEVRAVLRLVMERLAEGTPLHRMAVLYPTAEPYALLAHEQFQAAAVPHNSSAVRSLAQTLSGRTLLGLLRLKEADFRRDAVMDWLSAAPILEAPNGRPGPAHRWDGLSRSAGIVRGAGQWRERLGRLGHSLQRKLTDAEAKGEEAEWRVRRLRADLDHAKRLAEFVEELAESAQPGGRATWGEFAEWGRDLLERYLGGEGHRRDWPDDEIEAHRAVEAALESLSTLGELRPRTDETTFRRALERELESPAGRLGRFGEGVFIGRVGDALGTDFDVAFFLGMTEGLMPPRDRDDPLLPDSERAAGGEDVPLRATRRVERRRDYLAALAAAPERVLIFPRADQRGRRGRLPARWLLETASALEGSVLFSTDLDTRPNSDWFTEVPSFEGALGDGREPGSEQEYDLRSLLRWKNAGKRARDHYLPGATRTLREGLASEAARLSGELTRWDGAAGDGHGLAPSQEKAISPTALQNWAECPFRYFAGHVLRVAETEKPEDTLTITPLERGNLVHRALEQFVREAAPRSTPDEPWTEEERSRLLAIGERLCGEFESAGLTGKRLLWRIEREQILRDLASFADADEELRATHGVVPEAVELHFGDGGGKEVVAGVGGRRVAFRGRIDRVDREPDGSRLVVLDYKSGSPGWYKDLKTDPVVRGTMLQLPIYALAAQREFGGGEVWAYYWFVREEAGHEKAGYRVTEETLRRFGEALQVIVEGISAGLFPARPGDWRNNAYENCRLCPFDRVCPTDRARAWQRKAAAPELHAYVALAEDG